MEDNREVANVGEVRGYSSKVDIRVPIWSC
jgi:hypothetical protein